MLSKEKKKGRSMNKLPEGKRFSKDYQPERANIKKAAVTRESRKRLLKDLFGAKHLDSVAYKKFISMLKEAFYDPNTPLIERAKFAMYVFDKLAPKPVKFQNHEEEKPFILKITKTEAEAFNVDADVDEDDVETEDEYDEDEEDVETEDY
jgi:hypothetical protein